MAYNSLMFAQEIVARALVEAAREQSAAWNMRHAHHGHVVSAGANLECDHELAFCYIYEPPPATLAEITARMATLETLHAEAPYGQRGDLANELRKLDKQRRALARA